MGALPMVVWEPALRLPLALRTSLSRVCPRYTLSPLITVYLDQFMTQSSSWEYQHRDSHYTNLNPQPITGPATSLSQSPHQPHYLLALKPLHDAVATSGGSTQSAGWYPCLVMVDVGRWKSNWPGASSITGNYLRMRTQPGLLRQECENSVPPRNAGSVPWRLYLYGPSTSGQNLHSRRYRRPGVYQPDGSPSLCQRQLWNLDFKDWRVEMNLHIQHFRSQDWITSLSDTTTLGKTITTLITAFYVSPPPFLGRRLSDVVKRYGIDTLSKVIIQGIKGCQTLI